MVKVIKWFLYALILVVLTMIGAYYLAKKYEEPVRNYIVTEVNKRLNAPVHVSDINFSLLERFPSASLVMDSVWAEESIIKIGSPDTLFFFRKVYLNLNIFDIIDGQYKINEIETRDGFIRLLVDERGYDNFHIWRENQDTTGFLLELDQVHIENSTLSYKNLVREQDIRLLAKNLRFTGTFSEINYTMAVKGDGFVHDFILKGTNYLKDREVAVESNLDISTNTETYAFKKGRLLIDRVLDFNVSGQFVGNGIDLKIIGKGLDIVKSIALLPSESRTILDNYKSTGKLDIDCSLTGAFGNKENPRMKIGFQINNGTIQRIGSPWKLANLSGQGSLDNGGSRSMITTQILLEDLNGTFNEQEFFTKFSIVNLNRPTIDGQISLTSEIDAIRDFLNLEWVESSTGTFELDAEIHTTLDNPELSEVKDFLNTRASGMARMTDATIKLKEDDRIYRIDSSLFAINNNSLTIDYYRGAINQTHIELSGTANNLLDYAFTNRDKLDVKGDIKTGPIDLEALFPNSSTDEGSSLILAFPQRATWDLNIVAEKFTNGKFVADEVSGRLVMDQYKAEASSLHFLSMDGQVQGRAGIFRFGPNQYGLKTDFQSTDIDVKTLFETFNEFEQKYITSKEISGRADAEVVFRALSDSTLNIDMSSISATVDLTIFNGELTNFKPLISVASEIKKKPMLRLFVDTDELKNRLQSVVFDTLQNEIIIKNGVVKIPRMEIRSSAVDMNVSGTHTFDNEINYSIDFALSELMQLKNRSEPYNEFVRRDNKGRTVIYLTMIGTTEDYEVKLERTNVKSTLKEEMTSEKNEIKSILKEEFTGNPIDSESGRASNQPKEIEIEFDPEGKSTKKDSITSSTPEEKDKKVWNRLIKKTESDKRKLKEGEFEDDDF